jgi:transcriptional regulator with XRE-family HTH domain
MLVEQRKAANLTQQAVASKLGRYQSFIASLESGQRRLDVVELLDLSEAMGFDAPRLIRRLSKVKKR